VADSDIAPETLEALARRLESAERSARLHAMRATYFESAMRASDAQIVLIKRSTSWRLTAALRLPGHLLREGPAKTARRVARRLALVLRRARIGRVETGAKAFEASVRDAYAAPARRVAQAVVAPRVVIIAEVSLPQCAKYRVWQKQASLEALRTPCTVLDWRQTDMCESALHTHALAIFYRVPGVPKAMALIEAARRLGVTSYWEVDDLIFDLPAYLKNHNLDLLEPGLREEVLSGVTLYRAALLACDRGIASTQALAQAMRDAGKIDVLVIENALDDETLALAHGAVQGARRSDEKVVIGYGSGSKAHNADFLEAAPALAALMHSRAEIELQIMGELALPADLLAFGARVKRIPAAGYAVYLDWLATCDIGLAPLEDTAFNDAKSNIKFLEASLLGLPSVCSPRAAFRGVIEEGVDGFLASTTQAWLAALERLAGSPDLRRQVGTAAREKVLARYAPAAMRAQTRPLVQGLDTRVRKRMRVLIVNVFFWPQSYGGATIVTQEMARRLNASDEMDVCVFTTHALEDGQPYTLVRYEDTPDGEGIPVFAVRLPHRFTDPVAGFDNPQMLRCFNEVLAAAEPDIVHFHCLQGLSSTILDACNDRRLPFVVTVHDAWWLCERQFMVTAQGRYCAQTRIDVRVCEACIEGADHLRDRQVMALQRLSDAARLLFPSAFHRDLHVANGVDPARALVHRNGVRVPARTRPGRASGVLRFGYVGGNDRVKGINLVEEAFEKIERRDYKLVLVDNTTNAGYSSMRVDDWRLEGEVEIVPGYRQETMDAFFEGIDVLLFPSQWKESFGLTVREALIRDVWVIATDGGGSVEDIVSGENGTVLPFGCDAAALRLAVIALLDRPDRLAGYENPYKDRITTYEAQANELQHLLQGIVQEHRHQLSTLG